VSDRIAPDVPEPRPTLLHLGFAISVGPLAATIALLALGAFLHLAAWYRWLLLLPMLLASFVALMWWCTGGPRLIRQAGHRCVIATMAWKTRATTASFVRGWHEGDEWNFEYRFQATDGKNLSRSSWNELGHDPRHALGRHRSDGAVHGTRETSHPIP
jgi:hypothetical protein